MIRKSNIIIITIVYYWQGSHDTLKICSGFFIYFLIKSKVIIIKKYIYLQINSILKIDNY